MTCIFLWILRDFENNFLIEHMFYKWLLLWIPFISAVSIVPFSEWLIFSKSNTKKAKKQEYWFRIISNSEGSAKMKNEKWKMKDPSNRSRHRCSIKKIFLIILQNSQGNTCVGVTLLIKLQVRGWGLQLY